MSDLAQASMVRESSEREISTHSRTLAPFTYESEGEEEDVDDPEEVLLPSGESSNGEEEEGSEISRIHSIQIFSYIVCEL